jgi:PhnB protein
VAKRAKRNHRKAAEGTERSKPRKKVKPIPDNYPAVNVALRVKGAAEAIRYYERVFNAKLRLRLDTPDGKVGHAELEIGKGLVMVSDEFPEDKILGPKAIGGTPVVIQVYVVDMDVAMERAAAAGGRVMRPPKDEFYGDRSGMIEDPFGHLWLIQTHIEDVTPKQMKQRMEEMFRSSRS